MIQETLSRLVDGHHLSREESYGILNEIMTGKATEAQIGALLVALRIKGETAAELAGFARAMRDHAVAVPTTHDSVVDTCGTGGDAPDTFNISTTAALVVAAAGVPVAKHGNRSVSSQCGSADVLSQVGVNLELSAEQVGACLDEVGIGFLFAPALHPAMRYAMGPRRELGMRTVFNMLGPLTNPAGARRQLLGAFSREAAELMAEALSFLGTEHALVVHGSDGMDEITTCGPTYVFEVRGEQVEEQLWEPALVNLPTAQLSDLGGGDVSSCASHLEAILDGEEGPRRDIVLFNAAAGIYVGGRADSLVSAFGLAQEALDTGAAAAKLEEMRSYTNAAGA
jgi:anthranilate phosphoribosyltransferase